MKYEIIKDSIYFEKQFVLHRIRALIPIPRHGVKKGDLGGYILHGQNLSQEGDAWITDSAIACEEAAVYENALLSKGARARDNSRVNGSAGLTDNAIIRGYARASGDSLASGAAILEGDSLLTGSAYISQNAKLGGNAVMLDLSQAYGSALIRGNARMTKNSHAYGGAIIQGKAILGHDCQVSGSTKLWLSVTYENVFLETTPIKPPKRTKKAAISAAKKHLLTQFDDEGLM